MLQSEASVQSPTIDSDLSVTGALSGAAVTGETAQPREDGRLDVSRVDDPRATSGSPGAAAPNSTP
jgi:hypothetical protein